MCVYVCTCVRVTMVSLMMSQVSQLYQSITFSRLQELVPFISHWELEKVVVETAMNNKIQVVVVTVGGIIIICLFP